MCVYVKINFFFLQKGNVYYTKIFYVTSNTTVKHLYLLYL